MWIQFDSHDQFAIKVIVGGVNAISGEPLCETAATRLRRLNLMSEKKSVQDYVVTPDQLWLDGIASTQGCVCQFVAMPMGGGYTVEAQVTGEDVTGGLQFEVTPATQHSSKKLFIKTLTGKIMPFSNLSSSTTIAQLKDRICVREGIPLDQQRLIYGGKQLDDSKYFS